MTQNDLGVKREHPWDMPIGLQYLENRLAMHREKLVMYITGS
jgi:hypothetical protein